MDYFNELLESYKKLKKRTFKLVYLNEDDEAAESAAIQAALSLLSLVGSYPTKKGAGDLIVSQIGTDATSGFSVSGGPLGTFSYNYVTPAGLQTENPEGFKKIVNSLMDPDTEAAVSRQVSGVDVTFGTINGTSFDLPEIRSSLDFLTVNFTKLLDRIAEEIKGKPNAVQVKIFGVGKAVPTALRSYAANPDSPDNRNKAVRELVYNLIYGGKGLGKIFDGDKVLDSKEEGTKLVNDISPFLVLDTVEALGRVLDYIANPDSTEEDCDSIKGILSDVKGAKNKSGNAVNRVMIKLPTSSEGLIIPGGAGLFEYLKQQVKSSGCKDPIDSVYLGGISTNAINAKKGTMNEVITKLLFYMHKSLAEGSDSSTYQKALSETLKKNEEVVNYLIDVMKNTEGGWTDVDGERSEDLVRLEHSIFSNPKKRESIEKFLNSYYSSLKPLFDSVGADSMIHSGLTSKSGDRADNIFVFHSREAANKAAKRFGVSIQERSRADLLKSASHAGTASKTLGNAPETLYTLGLGQKIYEKFKGTKLGEFNRLTRLNDMVMGKLTRDASVDPNFTKALDDRFPLRSGSLPTLKKLNSDHETIYKSIPEENDYLSSEGKRKKTSPIEYAKRILGTLQSSLSYSDLKGIGISKKDVRTEAGRSAIAEKIATHNQVATLDNMLSAGGEKASIAKNIILRQAFACGGNSDNIIQSLYDQSTNRVLSFSHNFFFDSIENVEDVNITRTGTGFSIEYKGLTVKLQHESTGSKKGLTKHTRSVLLYTGDTVVKASEAFGIGSTTAKDLEEMFRIQRRLLERLID